MIPKERERLRGLLERYERARTIWLQRGDPDWPRPHVFAQMEVAAVNALPALLDSADHVETLERALRQATRGGRVYETADGRKAVVLPSTNAAAEHLPELSAWLESEWLAVGRGERSDG